MKTLSQISSQFVAGISALALSFVLISGTVSPVKAETQTTYASVVA